MHLMLVLVNDDDDDDDSGVPESGERSSVADTGSTLSEIPPKNTAAVH